MVRPMNWDHLRIFLAVLRAGSLRGASDELKVNHATISRAISGLETRLGTRIFDRSSAGLSLNEAGISLVEHAEEIERQTDKISRKILGLDAIPSGEITVSIPPSFAQGFLAPILASFTIAYPDIKVRLIATNEVTNLARQEADISIRVGYQVEDDLVGRRLLTYVVGVFASPQYLLAHPNLQVGDGDGAHWIGWGEDELDWVKDSPFPNADMRHSLPEPFMQIEAAANHIGMVMIPCFLGDSDTRLVRVPDVKVEANRSIWLLLHNDLRKTARVRAFVDHAAGVILANRAAFLY